MNIPVAQPVLGEEEAGAARRSILSGWVTQGPEVKAFENEWAAYTGAAHACAVSNCTTALHLALIALGVGEGDEVITVSHSYIATANSVRHCGATPVFVDVEPDTFNIDAQKIEEAISPATKAILTVHQMGMPCDMESILVVAKKHGLRVVEDAACAIGSEICFRGEWRRIGRPMGDIVCFSLHPRKVLTTGDGGMITTDSESWDKEFRLLRQHGMSVSDSVRHASDRVIFESYPVPGYNYRMTDPQAAIGREQLKRLPGILERRRLLAARYRDNLRGVLHPHEPEWARSNWQSYCVRLPEDAEQVDVMQGLLDRGISTRRGIMCAHREGAYASLPCRHPLPQSEKACDRCIILPLYPAMSSEEQNIVISALHEILGV